MPNTTSSQTIGPYWHLLEAQSWADLTRFGAPGEVIHLNGHIHDGAGAPVTDACVEIWQSSPARSERFFGFGRSATDGAGAFGFKTIKPQAVPGPGNTLQAPHIALTIFARGLLLHLCTRVYFADEPLNENDPILGLIEDPARRATLLAQKAGDGIWQIGIHLQGDTETVFLDI